jgi:sulfopyruvate decarboxylase, alpha subunit
MNEKTVIQIMKSEGIDLVASLPCDKNKCFTSLLHESFDTIDLTREEDGVGICAGAVLSGKKPLLSIQSSGLGNMLNAIMSLTCVYELPLPVLASWRGMDDEKIEAQIPFNRPLPKLLDVYGIPYRIFSEKSDLNMIGEVIRGAYEQNKPYVALILPNCWESEAIPKIDCPNRSFSSDLICPNHTGILEMKRADAISVITASVGEDEVLISNIGIPSKELFASGDRDLNFYMLGSYTQASSIGFGCSIGTKKKIYVIDGDGSLLGTSVLPVIASANPPNLTIIALDNGTFGSTGNQINAAYQTADLGWMAAGAGISHVIRAFSKKELENALSLETDGTKLIHVPIFPGNTNAPNISLSPPEIKNRFKKALLRL